MAYISKPLVGNFRIL